MKNNNYALFYKKTKYDSWHSKRPDMPVQLWEYYAHKQGYARFDIRNLKADDAYHLHQTTNVVRFNRKYYLPEEKIPYPEKEPKNIDNFEITVLWEDENNFFDSDYDEIYSRLDGLCTVVETDLGYIIVQCFTEAFDEFLEKLKREKQAVFHNEEITYFKWLCWLKDDKVRVIQQEYNGKYVKTFFDFLVDKDLFFSACEKMLNKMRMYEKKDLKRYQEYALKKYGKLLEKSLPYPETEPLQIGSFEITTDVQTNTESDFEEIFKTGDKLYTKVYTYLNFGDKTEEVILIAQNFAKEFGWFIKMLKEIENAVYEDREYTKTKLHAWLKDDFARLVYEDLSSDESEIVFDIAVDKNWFFETAEKMIIQMEKTAEKEEQKYKDYIGKVKKNA